MKRASKVIGMAAAAVAVTVTLSACEENQTTPPNAQREAAKRAEQRSNYVPKNDIEASNYNKRQEISDQPSTILWCTAFPSNPSAPAITVPVVGKITSGSKRPYPTEQLRIDTDTMGYTYNPELPGPDGMYGSSGEYRYGFRPDGVMVDFYNLETFCTTEPTVYQREKTVIDLGTNDALAGVTQQAEDALKAGDAAEAQRLLETIVGGN